MDCSPSLAVVDALRCAIELQRDGGERNAAVPPDRRIEYRIGIHQGDSVVEDGDIFGDGVDVDHIGQHRQLEERAAERVSFLSGTFLQSYRRRW
jgi:hypothetical protein